MSDDVRYCGQCREYEKQVEQLQCELSELASYDLVLQEGGINDCDRAIRVMNKQRAEIRRMRVALKQYADQSNWNCAGGCAACDAYLNTEDIVGEHVRDWWMGDDPGFAIAKNALAGKDFDGTGESETA